MLAPSEDLSQKKYGVQSAITRKDSQLDKLVSKINIETMMESVKEI